MFFMTFLSLGSIPRFDNRYRYLFGCGCVAGEIVGDST
jgi:hypothetical protein